MVNQQHCYSALTVVPDVHSYEIESNMGLGDEAVTLRDIIIITIIIIIKHMPKIGAKRV